MLHFFSAAAELLIRSFTVIVLVTVTQRRSVAVNCCYCICVPLAILF